MNIGSRLSAAFSSILFIIGAGAVITTWQFAAVVSDAREIIAVDNRLTSVQQVERDIGVVSRQISRLVEQQDDRRLLSDTQAVRGMLAEHLKQAIHAFGNTGAPQRRALTASTRSVFDELEAIDRLARAKDWLAIRLRVNLQLDQILRDIGDVVHQVANNVTLDREAALQQIESRRYRAQIILGTTTGLSLIASLLLGYFVTRSITAPLLALKRAAHQLAAHDFDLRVRTDTRDELAEVGKDLLIASNNLRDSYRALERSNADLEHFAYAVSHDLREPLRTVQLLSELLERQYSAKLEPEGRDFLDHIRKAAARMSELITAILAYSRITHSRGQTAEELNVEEIVETVRHDLHATILESDAEICVNAPLPSITANRAQLVQIFQNLMGNALKYRRRDLRPVIRVSAEMNGAKWIFSVKDNGIGIAPEQHRRIFEPFHQIDSSRAGGVGLGLATTKRLVEQLGGELWVQSDGTNGSEFFFSVPAHVSPAARDKVNGQGIEKTPSHQSRSALRDC